jgi:cell division initiation protein
MSKFFMNWTTVEIEHKRFHTRWMGLDAKEVGQFCQQLTEETHRLGAENNGLRKDLQEQEKELLEHKEREKMIRAVLFSVHKTAEQIKANAEKEAQLIVAEAELKAEKILQGTHQRLADLDNDIAELKRQRLQLETKLRNTLETYQQLLNTDREDEKQDVPGSKVKLLNR